MMNNRRKSSFGGRLPWLSASFAFAITIPHMSTLEYRGNVSYLQDFDSSCVPFGGGVFSEIVFRVLCGLVFVVS